MNIFIKIIQAIKDALFGSESHSAVRYVYITAPDARIREDHLSAKAGVEIAWGEPVSIVANPHRKWWQFWRPKLIVVPFNGSHPNCRCVIHPLEEKNDDHR